MSQVAIGAIRAMLAPVVLMTVSAILAGGVQTMYAAVNDRMRAMTDEKLSHLTGGDEALTPITALASVARMGIGEIDAELPLLRQRHQMLRDALQLLYAAVLVVVVAMILIAVDKGVTPAAYPKERVDTVTGANWSDVVSIFIVIATAAAIAGSGALQTAEQAAAALRPVVGPVAPQLFAFGLLGASLLAASVVPLSTSYAVADAAGATGRCRPACVRHPCSTVCSPSRSSSAPRSPWHPATWFPWSSTPRSSFAVLHLVLPELTNMGAAAHALTNADWWWLPVTSRRAWGHGGPRHRRLGRARHGVRACHLSGPDLPIADVLVEHPGRLVQPQGRREAWLFVMPIRFVGHRLSVRHEAPSSWSRKSRVRATWDGTPNLTKTWRRWESTVWRDMNSRSPTSRLVSPSATNPTTCSSDSLRLGHP